MTGDEQLGWVGVYFWLHLRRVFPRVPANMGHPDIHLLTPKAKVLGIFLPDLFTVNVSINTTERLEGSKRLSYTGAKIASMPDLITSVEIFENSLV